MRTKTIKTEAQLLDAIGMPGAGDCGYAELFFKDSLVIGARVGRARFESPYGIAITEQIEREEEERHRVRVDHPHFSSLNRYFDNSRQANDFATPYLAMPDATVTLDLVTVQVDATTGRVLGEVEDGVFRPLMPQDGGGDEIPF